MRKVEDFFSVIEKGEKTLKLIELKILNLK